MVLGKAVGAVGHRSAMVRRKKIIYVSIKSLICGEIAEACHFQVRDIVSIVHLRVTPAKYCSANQVPASHTQSIRNVTRNMAFDESMALDRLMKANARM